MMHDVIMLLLILFIMVSFLLGYLIRGLQQIDLKSEERDRNDDRLQ